METPLTPLEFARRARKLYPDRVAVIDGDSRWTYAQFLDRCDRWSAVLQKLGIGPGDRVAYLSPNTHAQLDRKSTRLNSSHSQISYAVFCLKKKKQRYGWPNDSI